ncbi:MAG: hypothetical protein IKF14_05235 [Atopobiaceae bacterium]|nr:hypothetical protein [Atopobiaceae bacterium]MBR3158493.1 hypothetical protein [Atopobiaceae bacterium]
MGKTEIVVNDEWKIVKIDACNWQVFNKREIGKPIKKDVKSRAGEVDWVALPAFFGRPDGAARYVFDHMGDKAGKKTLREFINLMKSSRDEVTKACAR